MLESMLMLYRPVTTLSPESDIHCRNKMIVLSGYGLGTYIEKLYSLNTIDYSKTTGLVR